jgi:hypothetical protein
VGTIRATGGSMRIEDHRVIGDAATAALVGVDISEAAA